MFYVCKDKNGIDYKNRKYKKGEFIFLETGLANKLILNGTIDKCDQSKAKKAEESKVDKKAELAEPKKDTEKE